MSVLLALTGCGTGQATSRNVGAVAPATTLAAPTTVPGAAREAVIRWLGHLATHDDAAAFADLAPGSRAAVGDLANYQRGSGRFGAVYSRFANPDAEAREVLGVTNRLVVVTLRLPAQPAPALVAVPVRYVGQRWQVDPLLDAGTYSFRPDDGATVERQPTVTIQLDDPTTSARVWFDDSRAVAVTPSSFQSRRQLSPGWHVATVVLLRGNDVVARALALRVV